MILYNKYIYNENSIIYLLETLRVLIFFVIKYILQLIKNIISLYQLFQSNFDFYYSTKINN